MYKITTILGSSALALVALSLSACGSGSAGGSGSVKEGCKPAHTFKTVKPGTLTVAYYDLPPFAKTEGGSLSGVDADILKIIADKECLTITPSSLAPAAVIPSVQAGRADVAASAWYRTKARAAVVGLPDPLYLDQQAFISKDGVKSYDQLSGRKVGTVDGYMWVNDAKKLLGGDLKVYNNTLNLNQDLKAGRIDVGIDSYGSGVYNNPNLKVEVVTPDPRIAGSDQAAQATLPVAPNNKELLAAINDDIAQLKKAGDIVKILKAHNLPETAANTGAPRLL